MDNKLKIVFAVTVAALAVFSCKSQYDAVLNSADVDLKYNTAFEYYNAGKYSKAAALFESLSYMTNGTMRDDTVQYYWGLSNYRMKDYYTAETNFAKFVENYPRSTFSAEARYLRIYCLYKQTLRYELDQSTTYTAINAINEYLREYPDNDHVSDCNAILSDLGARLDRKAYEAARLYYKMEDYKAARVAFRNILKDDADNIYREDILYYIAMSSYKYAYLSVKSKQRERYLTFVDDYLNFIGEIPESPYRKELDALYVKAQKALGNYVGSEEEQDDKSLKKASRAIEKAKDKAENRRK